MDELHRWIRRISVGLMHVVGWGTCAVWVAVTILVGERETAEARAEPASTATTPRGRSYAAPPVHPQSNADRLADELALTALPEVLRLRRTLMRWRTEILAYFPSRLTNGRVEGFNLKAKLVKRRAYG